MYVTTYISKGSIFSIPSLWIVVDIAVSVQRYYFLRTNVRVIITWGDFMNRSVATREELELIRNYVLLPIMLDVIQNNSDKLKYDLSPLNELFLLSGQKLMDRVHDDLAAARKEMRRIGIKVEETDRERAALHFTFWIRGYEDTFSLIREVIKAEISTRLARYIDGMFK